MFFFFTSIDQLMMAESSSEPAAAAHVLMKHSKEEPSFSTETSKELIVTMATEALGQTPGPDVSIEVRSGNSDSPLPKVPKEEEATPPESSPLSPENGTITTVTTEEESVSDLLRHIKTEEGQEGDPGKSLDQVPLEKEIKKQKFFIFKEQFKGLVLGFSSRC